MTGGKPAVRWMRACRSAQLAVLAVAPAGCGHCGVEFQEGPSDMGGLLIDARTFDAAADAEQGDASPFLCVVGQGPHATVQSALDDTRCPVVTVPAGRWEEHLVVNRVVEVVGAGHAQTIFDGTQTGRTLAVTSGALVLRDVSITGGVADVGAGIDARADLQLIGVRVHDNRAEGALAKGGGIALHDAALSVGAGVSIESNEALASGSGDIRAVGGGLYAEGNLARIDVEDAVAVANNRAFAIQGNGSAQAVGGGLALEGGASFFAVNAGINLDDNDAEMDSTAAAAAAAFARGGAVDCSLGVFHMYAGRISGNTSSSDTQSGEKSQAFGGGLASIGCTVDMRDVSASSNAARGECDDCVIEAAGGGAYAVSSNVSIQRGLIVNNQATFTHNTGTGIGGAIGGGLYVQSGDALVEDTTIANNEVLGTISDGLALGYGGGVAVDTSSAAPTTVLVKNTTLGPGNRVVTTSVFSSFQLGGGVVLGNFLGLGEGQGTLTMVNATISGNELDSVSPVSTLIGAGLAVDDSSEPLLADLIHVTVTDNHARTSGGDGGGVGTAAHTDGYVYLQNSLVFGNTASAANTANCQSTDSAIRVAGRNFIGAQDNGECPLDFDVGGAVVPLTDPEFGPLQDNGGATHTHAISSTSSARDRARVEECVDENGSALAVDQRGLPRIECDSGAFEVQ